MPEFETVIGLEVHAQLLTASKMFCGCSAEYADAPPNTHVCPVCLGMPGVLPVINRKAIEYLIMTALALNCQIPLYSKFDRKNYPYPDLMKGYQISQYDLPLSQGGWLAIDTGDGPKRIGITRVHMEEDTARLLHRVDPSTGEAYSLIDVNRSGVPLMEIVSEPDMSNPEEAGLYLKKLRQILRWIGVSTGNMEEGSFRCDANVSLRPRGSQVLGAKVEVKNMNSFRAVESALRFEVERQQRALDAGEVIHQETRGWVEDEGVTVLQRSKEFAHDYRYFPEPDLPPLEPSRAWVDELRHRLPELPDQRRDRLVAQFGLAIETAEFLTESRPYADYFEEVVAGSQDREHARTAANWIKGELRGRLNAAGTEITDSPVSSAHLRGLLALMAEGSLSGKMAKEVFDEMYATGGEASTIVSARGLGQISDESRIDQILREVLDANPRAVEDFRAGKEQAFKYLVGQAMKATRGQANPALVNIRLRQQLASLV